MSPKKEFAIISGLMLFFGLIDIANIAIGFFGADAVAMNGHPFLIALFAFICLISLAKLYMGGMGLAFCKGCGKGKLHITIGKIAIVFAAIGAVIAIIDAISGTGSIKIVISDLFDVYIFYWYYSTAKKVCA